MDNDKSILEKIADTVKDIANVAAEAADHALKAEKPSRKVDDIAAAYMPLAADGFVSDPMMVPPVAPARKRRAAAKRTANKATKKTASRKTTGRKTARKSVERSAGKAGRKSAAVRSRRAVKKTAGNAGRKPAKKARKSARRKT
jgi:hypothetical protein